MLLDNENIVLYAALFGYVNLACGMRHFFDEKVQLSKEYNCPICANGLLVTYPMKANVHT